MAEKDGPYRGEWDPEDQPLRMGDDGKLLPLEPWEQELLKRSGREDSVRKLLEHRDKMLAAEKIASASGTEEEIPGASARDLEDLQRLLSGSATVQGGLQLDDASITLVDHLTVGIVTQGDGRPHVAISVHTEDGETFTRALVPFEAMRFARAVLESTEQVLSQLPDDAVDEQDVVDGHAEQVETDE